MEIFNESKLSKWKNILKKLNKTKIADPKRLDTIENQIDKGKSPYESDIEYLEKKYAEWTESDSEETPQETIKKLNYDTELKIIEYMHQKEIGDFSRLESIKNYLMVGQPLLQEDRIYLKEQSKQLETTVTTNDERADPISGATVTLVGAGAAVEGTTGNDGTVTLPGFSPTLNANVNEAYMKLTVKSTGFEDFEDVQAVSIVRLS